MLSGKIYKCLLHRNIFMKFIEFNGFNYLHLQEDAQGDWIWEGSKGSQPTYTNWFNETDEFQFNCSYMDTGKMFI